MSDLEERIRRLLGYAAGPHNEGQSRYHAAFDASGVQKAKEILAELATYQPVLGRLAYLSLGGSTGAEILHILQHSAVQFGVMLEVDDEAAAVAEERVRALKGKTLRVFRGDATGKVAECRRVLERWRDDGKIDGVICSIQAVLHELPTRSPGYDINHLLGEAIWDWDPCFFFCREPCSPQQWPERVKLAIRGVRSAELEALATHVRGMLRMEGEVRRSGPNAILTSRDIAVEVLFKIFYIEDYSHEIEERITSVEPERLAAAAQAALKPGTVSRTFLNSASFERLYHQFGVEAVDPLTNTPLPLPIVYLRLVGKRDTRPHLPSAVSASNGDLGDHRTFVQDQAERILNFPLLPWSPQFSPSLRVLWPELLIDPELRPHKNPAPSRPLSQWANQFGGVNVAVVGTPGAGKSTALRRLFLKAIEHIEEEGSPYPVIGHVFDYVSRGANGRLLIETLLSEARRSGKAVVHFIDGLDEMDDRFVERFVEDFLKSVPSDESVWITCRSEYFFNRFSVQAGYYEHFREVLEIRPWRSEETYRFVELYADRIGNVDLVAQFVTLTKASSHAAEFARNPFHLTLILYLLGSEVEIGTSLTSAFALYDEFYRHWVRRESHRGTSTTGDAQIRGIHIMIAERLFDARGSFWNRGLAIEGDLKVALDDDSAVADLLRVEQNRIISFRHETIGEYLLASHVLSSLSDPDANLHETLLRTYTFETNAFVREGLESLQAMQRDELIRLLSLRYRQYLTTMYAESHRESGHVDPESKIREQLLYYIGRIPSAVCPEVLRFAFANEVHPLLVRAAALGAILHGDESIEEQYLARLTPGSTWDADNRAIQLLYFGDAHGDFFLFRDDGELGWDRTRSAILQRLTSRTPRDERLRRWDLRTFRLFLLSRREVPGPDEVRLLERAHLESGRFSDRRHQFFADEIASILELGRGIGATNS